MNCKNLSTSTLMIFMLVCLTSQAQAQPQTVDMTFVWTACPAVDEDGVPCSEAVVYEVFLQRDDEREQSVGMVYADTTYTLAAESGVTQRIRVCGYDEKGRASELSEWSDPVYFNANRTGQAPPSKPELTGNFPNPFNPETRIAYGIPEDLADGTPISLDIYNLQGYRVRTMEIETTAGWHEVMWDGSDDGGQPQSTGIYLTQFVCGTTVEVSKMTMIK